MASTGLILGAYGSLNYHKELTTTSFIYAGALPTAATIAITQYLQTFAANQHQKLPQGWATATTQRVDPLLRHYNLLTTAHPAIGKVLAPIYSTTTKSMNTIITASLTRIQDALIFRASTMQRVITALVQRRQRQLKRKRKTNSLHATPYVDQQRLPRQRHRQTPAPKRNCHTKTPTQRTTARPNLRQTMLTTNTSLAHQPGSPEPILNPRQSHTTTCTKQRCRLARASGRTPGSYQPPKQECQQCYRFDRTLRITADLEATLLQSPAAMTHLTTKITSNTTTIQNLLNILTTHTLTKTAIARTTTIRDITKSTGDMIKLAIARLGTTLAILEPHTPFTDPYTTTPIVTRCTCSNTITNACTPCNYRYRLMHQSSNLRWTHTCQNPATPARDKHMQQVYHPPTHLITHPFTAPTQTNIQKNQHLCMCPPPTLSQEHPRNAITPTELNRLLPAHPYTMDKWMNDVIINTFLEMMHAQSPYNNERHFTSTYFAYQARQHPAQTNKFFTTTTRTYRHYKPPPRAPLLMIPVGTGSHWYLLIRTQHKYTCIDSDQTGATTISKDKRDQLDAIRNTPAHWIHPHGPKHFDPTKGFIQRDGHNCGVFLLIHAYVYLFHPRPHQYQWTHQPPHIVHNFRHFIITCFRTNCIPNLFSHHAQTQ